MTQFPVAARRMLAGLALAALALPAAAQTYPNKPIKLVIGNPAGEAIDVIFRMIGERMTAQLGQPIVVDNRPGAASMIGLDATIQSPPDGYTLGTLTSPTIISGLLNGRTWNPDAEMTALGLEYQQGVLITLNPTAPLLADVKTPADIVRVVKANPGKINFGSIGVGSTGHLIGELMKDRASLNWVHVPFKGGVPLVQEIVAGREPIIAISGTFSDAERNPGKMIVVATTGTKPVNGVQPLASVFPGLVATTWGGLIGPGKLPAPIVQRLAAAYKVAWDTPEIQEKAGRILTQEYLGPAEMQRLIHDAVALWGKIIKDNNIKLSN